MDAKDIAEKYGAETALLILLGRLQYKTVTSAEVQHFINTQTINWSRFDKIIKVHQVRPMVYNMLSVYSIETDTDFYRNLQLTTTRIAAGNLLKLKELIRVHALLKHNNIRSIPYKGVILSKILYGDFISRETSDIDFIIHPEDFSKTRDVLLNDGYGSTYYYNPEYRELFLKSDNELLFAKKKSDKNYKVEIHWAVTHKMMDIPFPDREIFQDTAVENILDNEIEILSPQNRLIVLLIHHGVNDIWRTFRHSVDIATFIQKYASEIDWDETERQVKKYKIYNTTRLGLSLCRELYGISIPAQFGIRNKLLNNIGHNMLRFPPIKRKKLSAENILQQFRLRDSVSNKFKLLVAYISTALLPNIRDVEAWPIPAKWSFIYVFIKPFRLVLSPLQKRNNK